MSADHRTEPEGTNFEDLVFLCLERIEEEGEAAIDSVCEAHPDQAAELREHLNVLRAAGLLGAGPGEEQAIPEQFGEFRVIERLGAGGMGVVLLAEQESLGRRVALKLVRPDRVYSNPVRVRFRREIDVISRLAHPGIVSVYGAGEERGIPYFVMEYVEGTGLDRVLHFIASRDHYDVQGSELHRAIVQCMRDNTDAESTDSKSPVFDGSWSDACLRIVRQVAEALEHAHRRGVLHRDVKPSNLVVTPSGRAMLLDFGLALKDGDDRMTRTGAEIGSLPYMAPERLGQEGESGVREDVYALGVLLYECLSFRLPYEGKSSMEILKRMQAGVVPPLRRWAPSVHPDCETVCLVAMDHDPSRRYPSAEAMARDLTNILEGRPIEARRASFARRSIRWCRRNPAAAVAWALGAVILIGGPLVYGEQQRVARERIEGINATLKDANEQIEKQNTELASALTEAENQRSRATRHFGMAVGSVRFLTDTAIDELIDVPQAAEAKRKMLAGALAFFGQFLSEAMQGDLESRALRIEVARAHQLTGDIQLHLGESEVGAERLQSAVDSYAALVAEEGTLEMRQLHADALRDLGRMHVFQGRIAEGQARIDEAIELFYACLEEDPDHREVLFGLQEALAAEAGLHADRGQLVPALEGYQESLSILDSIIPEETGFVAERFTRARIRNRLGETFRSAGKMPEAVETFALALEELEDLLAGAPERVDLRSEQLTALSNSANTAAATGRLDDAQAMFDQAIEIGEQLTVKFPGYDNNYHLLAVTYLNQGGLFAMLGDTEQSLAMSHLAEELLLGLLERNPNVTRYSMKLAGAQANLGFGYLNQGEATRASEYLEEAHARAADVLEQLTGDADTLETFMLTSIGLGYAREATENFEGMVEALEVLLDSNLDAQRLTRAASMTCDIADEIDKRENLEQERKAELHERLLDCAEELVHLAFDRISNPAPLRQALQAPEFAPLRERPAIADRLGG